MHPSLALSVETEELGIAAGLQDRVIQVYEGLVYMDFARERMQEHQRPGLRRVRAAGPGTAAARCTWPIAPTPANRPRSFTTTSRHRFRQGEPAVVAAMGRFADLTVQARQALREGDHARFGRLLDANFDLRRSICRLAAAQVEMVASARRAGATAQFAGSGGAIVGTCADEETFRRLATALQAIGCRVVRPMVEPPRDASG